MSSESESTVSSSSAAADAAPEPTESKARAKGAKGKKRRTISELTKRSLSRPAAKRLFVTIGRPLTKGEKEVDMRLSRSATKEWSETVGKFMRSLAHDATRQAKRQGRTTVTGQDVHRVMKARKPRTKIFPSEDYSLSEDAPSISVAAPAL